MKLSYSTHGLPGSLFDILDELEKAGYAGVELAFQVGEFDLREIPLSQIANCPVIKKLQAYFKKSRIRPAAINTATLPLTPGLLHEPSVISLNEEGRKQRIQLIQKGIAAARALGAPIVTFGSGFIRAEHVPHFEAACEAILLASIRECLSEIAEEDEVTLVIEPEPGMLIETLEQGAKIVETIASKHFGLHLDVCHAFCSDGSNACIEAIREVAHLIKYVHLADTQTGYNLKIIDVPTELKMDLDFDFASYLLHSPRTGDFVFVNGQDTLHFPRNKPLPPIEPQEAHRLAPEIQTYLLSMPRIAYETMDRAVPILQYLRTTKNPQTGRAFIEKRLANTLSGKVHFHQAPGQGEIDFSAVSQCLNEAFFQGYASLELYHDGQPDRWKQVMQRGKADLDSLCWTEEEQGEVDHHKIHAPSIRLVASTKGHKGDWVYLIDLRITVPNQEFLAPQLLHSFEHLLLAGFRKYLGKHFINVAPMGCQTGFYLTLLNEGRVGTICEIYAAILEDILALSAVPYANPNQCGQAAYHDLAAAQNLAQTLLSHRTHWRQVLR